MADVQQFPSVNGVSDVEKGLGNPDIPNSNSPLVPLPGLSKLTLDEFKKTFKKIPQTLVEVDFWFEKFIIPLRGTSAGFSLNRIVKSPKALVQGNKPDPDGLCGDASSFVIQQYNASFSNRVTFDGFEMAQIVWNDSGELLNHVANLMIPKKFGFNNKYFFDKTNNSIVPVEANFNDDPLSVLSFHVYDLYYKETAQSVEQWWQRRGNKFGSITILI